MLSIKTIYGSKEVVPTIFPDGTSQVWKIDAEQYRGQLVHIVWEYERESELIHLIQLLQLLYVYEAIVSNIFIPYLPYGRQDKTISDVSTFAQYTFLATLFDAIERHQSAAEVVTLDAHSECVVIENITPEKYIEEAIKHSKADFIIFPDKGALSRYEDMIMRFPYVVLDKDRDQLTGNILGMKFKEGCEATKQTLEKIVTTPRRVRSLIVDDICDGGMTFIKAAEFVKSRVPNSLDVDLYVTHGIFSKGVLPLYDAGIGTIYTTRSLNRFRINAGLGEFGSLLETNIPFEIDL